MHKIGPQSKNDHKFRAKARLHQSRYRAEVLQVGFCKHGNWLKPEDAKKLLVYYDKLGVRQQLRLRFSNLSMKRDGNLLNSEHIPFNFFGPLANDFGLAKQMINSCLDIDCMEVLNILFEYWPEPQQNYLDDGTKFDVYVEFKDHTGAIIGIGIEVKYSEKSYSPKKKELSKSQDRNSLYWQVTEESGHFVESGLLQLTSNNLRQVWRNHLLGLSMVLNDDIKKFHSITLFPAGNTHFFDVLDAYRNLLIPKFKNYVFPLTYEKFIDSIDGNGELLKWKKYLKKRYLFN